MKKIVTIKTQLQGYRRMRYSVTTWYLFGFIPVYSSWILMQEY